MQSTWRLVAVVLASSLLVACGGNSRERVEARIANGDRLLKENKLNEALIEYQTAVQLDERNGTARLQLGRAFLRVGDVGRAMDHLVRAADLLPQDNVVQLEAARALLSAGRFEDARTRVETVIKTDPKNVDAHVLRASAPAGLKDPSGAIATLEEAIKLDPTRSDSVVSLATLQAAAGRMKEAEAGYKQAVTVDPKSPDARLALANFYWVTGRTAETERTLLDGLAADATSLPLNRSLASVYLSLGRAADAEVPLKRIADASGAPEARLTLADYYIGQERRAEARSILEVLAKEPAAAAAARARLAGIEYEAGNPAAAHRMIDALIAEQPTNAQVRVAKGGWLLREKKFDEALVQAEAALKADPKSAEAIALLGSVQIQRRRGDEAMKAFTEVLQLRPGDVGAQVTLADLNVEQGRYAEAVSLARQAIRADPRNGAARLALTRALIRQGQPDQAQIELRPLLEAGPSLAPVLTLAGQIQALKGNEADARRFFTRALESEPGSVQALAGLVNLDLAAKRGNEAARRIESQIGKTPDDAVLLLLAGRTYAATGDLARSEAALRKAIAVDPALMESYHVLGQIFVRQNKLDDARAAYELRLKERPNDVGMQTMVGMIQLVQGDMAGARARFEKVLSIDPRSPMASNNLAYMDAEAGTNLDVALNRAQTAKAADPDDANVNDTLGWVYVKRGLPALAVPSLEQAVQKDPKNPIFLYHLGMAHVAGGDKDRARASLQRALQLSKSFEGAADAQRALDALGR